MKEYAESITDLQELIGISVASKGPRPVKGDIVSITGSLGDQRDRLLNIAKQERSLRVLRDAPDDELVVGVSSGRIHT